MQFSIQPCLLAISALFILSVSACPGHPPSSRYEGYAAEEYVPNKSYFDTWRAFTVTHPPPPELHHTAEGILITCMDVRLLPERTLGVEAGQVHVLRNAGGRVASLIPSIIISQKLLESTQITILHHTRCGMGTNPEAIRAKIAAASPAIYKARVDDLWIEGFEDLRESLIQDYLILKNNPLVNTDNVRLGIWDVDTNKITEVRPFET